MSAAALRFDRRAARYRSLDVQLAPHTRFFLAAAVTNEALRDLCHMRVVLSIRTVVFLCTLGGSLARKNEMMARRMPAGDARVNRRDKDFVSVEQTVVEARLAEFRCSAPEAYGQIMREIDALFNCHWPNPLLSLLFPTAAWYVNVLRTVRRQLGTELVFAEPLHRISIGHSLIAKLAAAHPGRITHRNDPTSSRRRPSSQ